MIEIQSTQNEHFRRWQDLSSSRGIKKHGEFLLMGSKLVDEFLATPHFTVKAELLCEGLPAKTLSCSSLRGQRIPVYKLSKALFNEVDSLGTHSNVLVLECPPTILLPSSHRPEGLEIIAPVARPPVDDLGES
ncbi:MAG: TrmH family RNA methyltransferase, partial [Bdellovibrio sp.]